VILSKLAQPYYLSGLLLAGAVEPALSKIVSENHGRKLLVIDAGCGRQPWKKYVQSLGAEYIGLDIKESISIGYAPPETLQIDEDGNWPVENGIADIVLSTQVLEHVENPTKYLAEAHRVLSVGGRLVLSTHGNYAFHGGKDYWRWTHQGIEQLLETNNFIPRRIVPLLTTEANAIFCISSTRVASLYHVSLIGTVAKALNVLLNVLALMIDRSGKRELDIFPNMFFAIADKR